MARASVARRVAALMALCVAPTGVLSETAHAEGDPWCDMLELGEAGAVDCALEGGPGVLFFDYETDEYGAGTMTLIQTTYEGGERITSDPVVIEGVSAQAPGFRDINLDGVEDLFIPVSEGMVNTTFAVWQQDADAVYQPSGYISGFGIDGFENKGELIISAERINAAQYAETAQLLDQDGFVQVYEMLVDYAEQSCTIADTDGIDAQGLNEDALIADCEDREWE